MIRTVVVAAMLLLAASLSGCALIGEPPAALSANVVVVTPEPPPAPIIPAECTMVDKPWVEIPDEDVRLTAAARNYKDNELQYDQLLGKRAVCRAALQQQFPKPQPKRE